MHYHMLLVCDILSSSTPHPEVNHGRASLPTFSLHTRLDSFTYALIQHRCCPLTTYRRKICWAVYIQNSGWPQEQHCAWNQTHRHTMHSNIVGEKNHSLMNLALRSFLIYSIHYHNDRCYWELFKDKQWCYADNKHTHMHTPTQNSNDLDLK